MAAALAVGWTRAGLIDPSRCYGISRTAESCQRFTSQTGIETTTELAKVCQADWLVLAVKPQMAKTVCPAIRANSRADQPIISVLAGVSLAQLENDLGKSAPIVRVMPNTPCLVGAAATGYSLSPNVSDEQRLIVEQLFSAVGLAVQVPETLLDAVTGVSGSGPAYGFVMIEALADGGVKAGLPREIAQRLAAQTLLGAAKMVLETGQHPGQLKDAVASPAGTTIAALHELERGGVRAALINAVEASANRAAELGRRAS